MARPPTTSAATTSAPRRRRISGRATTSKGGSLEMEAPRRRAAPLPPAGATSPTSAAGRPRPRSTSARARRTFTPASRRSSARAWRAWRPVTRWAPASGAPSSRRGPPRCPPVVVVADRDKPGRRTRSRWRRGARRHVGPRGAANSPTAAQRQGLGRPPRRGPRPGSTSSRSRRRASRLARGGEGTPSVRDPPARPLSWRPERIRRAAPRRCRGKRSLPADGLLLLFGAEAAGARPRSRLEAALPPRLGRSEWLGFKVARSSPGALHRERGATEPFRAEAPPPSRRLAAHEISGRPSSARRSIGGAHPWEDAALRERLRAFIRSRADRPRDRRPARLPGLEGVGSPAGVPRLHALLDDCVGLSAADWSFWLLHHPRKDGAQDERDEAAGAGAASRPRCSSPGGGRRPGAPPFPKLRWSHG